MSPPSRNQVISVPKRRPPRPHSCSNSRSPRRQWAAAKPSQVMKPNSRMKTVSAVQFRSMAPLLFGRPIDHGRYGRADEYERELEPVKERHAREGRFDRIVEGNPQGRDELEQKQQVPPTPGM